MESSTSVSAVFYPLNNQLEVFFVDERGALTVVWKAQNGAWHSPIRLTADGFAAPGSPVSAVFYPLNNQLEVFVVNGRGALNVVWKAQNGAWNTPLPVTPENFAPVDTPVSAVYYPPNNQLEVFVVNGGGALNVVWKAQNGAWNRPFALTAEDLAPVNTPLSAVYYPPNDHLEIFLIDHHGAFNVIWKAQNGAWHQPLALTRAGFAPVRAPLSAVYYPPNDQLEVFIIDPQGALNVIWKAQDSNWNAPSTLTQIGFATPLTPPVPVFYPPNDHLEVLFAGSQRSLNVVWKANDGTWNRPVGVTRANYLGNAVTWAAVNHPPLSQLEVFTADSNQVLYVEWKVNDGPWVPCPVALTPQPAAPPAPGSPAVVLETKRVAQLTGDRDPEDLPIINPTSTWGVTGVDLGANAEHDGKLFIFFGDVPKVGRDDGPQQDADLVAYTDDQQVGPGGVKLHPTMNGRYFDPLTVEAPVGIPGTNRGATGAFSFGRRVYVFVVVDNPEHPTDPTPVSILTSKDHPAQPGPYRVEFQFDHSLFWQVAPVVVDNASLPGLPQSTGPGVILLGGGNTGVQGQPDSIHLAWMPLPIIPRGRLAPSGIFYYTGLARQPWSPRKEAAVPLMFHPGYTSLSAAWFPAASTWMMLYSNAGPIEGTVPGNPAGSVVARIGPTPWQWSEEIEIFNPCRERAYGHYMHWPGLDQIWPLIPPDLGEEAGWAYGAFLTNRFCVWDAPSRVLTLHYLLSLSRPYQVQLMRSKLFLSA